MYAMAAISEASHPESHCSGPDPGIPQLLAGHLSEPPLLRLWSAAPPLRNCIERPNQLLMVSNAGRNMAAHSCLSFGQLSQCKLDIHTDDQPNLMPI
jgi:hypothetical protein